MLFTCLFIKKTFCTCINAFIYLGFIYQKAYNKIKVYIIHNWIFYPLAAYHHIYNAGADLEGGRTSPPPWNFQNIHIREHHFQRYQGVFLHANFKNFRLASLACHHIYLSRFHHYRSTIFQIALDISRSCIVHILSTSVESYRTPDIYSSTLPRKCQSTDVVYKDSSK